MRVKRRGAAVRAPSGFWAPFPASRLPAVRASRPYANLRTPHTSGLIQSWFRMAPAEDGRTRVTFAWVPRAGPRVPPDTVAFTATTFEGDEVHAARLGPLAPATADGPRELTFTAVPGPLQITMAIGAGRPLDTDVRYLDVPALDGARPSILAVEFVRPRSLPEFNALLKDAAVMPTETRAFHRQDRLLVRVRAFAAAGPPDVRVVLRNRQGTPLLELVQLPRVGDAAQFELPFARYPRGDYRLEVEARAGSERVSTVVTVSLLG